MLVFWLNNMMKSHMKLTCMSMMEHKAWSVTLKIQPQSNCAHTFHENRKKGSLLAPGSKSTRSVST